MVRIIEDNIDKTYDNIIRPCQPCSTDQPGSSNNLQKLNKTVKRLGKRKNYSYRTPKNVPVCVSTPDISYKSVDNLDENHFKEETVSIDENMNDNTMDGIENLEKENPKRQLPVLIKKRKKAVKCFGKDNYKRKKKLNRIKESPSETHCTESTEDDVNDKDSIQDTHKLENFSEGSENSGQSTVLLRTGSNRDISDKLTAKFYKKSKSTSEKQDKTLNKDLLREKNNNQEETIVVIPETSSAVELSNVNNSTENFVGNESSTDFKADQSFFEKIFSFLTN